MIEVEVCAYTLESCLNAQRAGAARVELCAGMHDGGTTPSAAQVTMARRLLAIELSVMIRPRGGDFLYTRLEFEQMKEDIRFARSSGADGVVLGILLADGSVDVLRVLELVGLAAPLRVTFHRAFDMTRNLDDALEGVIRAGCHRVLTSGGANRAVEGRDTLQRLARAASGRLQVMAGSGVDAANAVMLANTGVDALHLSGKSSRDSRMDFRNPAVSMGGLPGIPEYEQFYADATKIEAVVRALAQIETPPRRRR